jgi:hypothetical protein
LNRQRATAVLLALLAWPTSGCQCPNGSYHDYNIKRNCGGTFTVPAALQVDTAVPSDCEVTACDVKSPCLMNPESCTEVCFSIVSARTGPPASPPLPSMTDLIVLTQFTLDPTGAPTLALPDSRVRIAAHIAYGNSEGVSNVPKEGLSVTDGSLSVRLTQDHFEAHVTLNLTTGLGDRISIDDGTYEVSGSNVTTCNTQN